MKKGVSKKGIVRRDLTNKQKWVFEIYFADESNGKIDFRNYPNIVSARYLSKTNATKAVDKYMRTGKFNSWDEERKR